MNTEERDVIDSRRGHDRVSESRWNQPEEVVQGHFCCISMTFILFSLFYLIYLFGFFLLLLLLWVA